MGEVKVALCCCVSLQDFSMLMRSSRRPSILRFLLIPFISSFYLGLLTRIILSYYYYFFIYLTLFTYFFTGGDLKVSRGNKYMAIIELRVIYKYLLIYAPKCARAHRPQHLFAGGTVEFSRQNSRISM